MHFKTSTVLVLATAASQAFAHCVITSITGANGVTMPGLSVIDGTPRDCARYNTRATSKANRLTRIVLYVVRKRILQSFEGMDRR